MTTKAWATFRGSRFNFTVCSSCPAISISALWNDGVHLQTETTLNCFFPKTKYCTRICKTRYSVSTRTEGNVHDQRSTVVAKWVQTFTHNRPVFYKSSCTFSRTYKYLSVCMINSTAIFLYLLFNTLNLTYFNVMSTFQDIFFWKDRSCISKGC